VLSVQNDGALLLEPAEVMTVAERRFMENTELQARLAYLNEHPEVYVKSARREQRRQQRVR